MSDALPGVAWHQRGEYHAQPTEKTMDITSLVAQLVGGAVGGSAGGKAVKGSDLGQIGNLIAGAVGGIGGGNLLGPLIGGGAAAGGLDIANLAGQLVGGGAGGLVLQVIAGLVANKVFRK